MNVLIVSTERVSKGLWKEPSGSSHSKEERWPHHRPSELFFSFFSLF
jgi:hypothetical protein